MSLQSLFRFITRFLIAFAIGYALSGCSAFGPTFIDHSFGFDMRHDNQDAEVLDYWYGGPKYYLRADESRVRKGDIFYAQGVSQPMMRPDALYVKWRNKTTGQIYEDRVDLRHRLPKDIAGKRVYFMIRGSQLYVYLISKERRAPETPPIGPRTYRSDKITQIYPEQPT